MLTRTPRQDFESTNEWRVAFGREFKKHMDSGCEFSSDDIRELVGLPPEAHPNVFGSEWRYLLNTYRDFIRIAGIRRSRVRASRGRMLLTYRKVG